MSAVIAAAQEKKPKRKKPTPLKSISARLLRFEGHTVEDVERRIPTTFISQDFMGFADLLGLHESYKGVTAYQVTHSDRAADHIKTITASEKARRWCACGNRIVLHLWDKRGLKGTEKKWNLFESEIWLGEVSGYSLRELRRLELEKINF